MPVYCSHVNQHVWMQPWCITPRQPPGTPTQLCNTSNTDLVADSSKPNMCTMTRPLERGKPMVHGTDSWSSALAAGKSNRCSNQCAGWNSQHSYQGMCMCPRLHRRNHRSRGCLRLCSRRPVEGMKAPLARRCPHCKQSQSSMAAHRLHQWNRSQCQRHN